jgi:branched-chain amino acid transport system permease protein
LRPAALISAVIAGFIFMAPIAAMADETPLPTATAPTDPVPTETVPTGDAVEPDGPIAGTEEVPQAQEPPDSEYYVSVTLLNSAQRDENGDGTPLPGIGLTVEDEDGTEVGDGVSGPEGRAFIAIPGSGPYTVVLDQDTLPDGIELSDEDTGEREINVFLTGATNVQFQIGVEAIADTPFYKTLSQSVVNGLKYGLIIALAGLGLSLVFGTTGLTNFAHGELITFGAIMTYAFNRGFGLPVIAAGIMAVIAAAILGWVQDKVLWAPLRNTGKGLIAMMIVSIGLALLGRSMFQYTFGGSTRTLSEYVAQQPVTVGPVLVAPKEFAIMAISIVTIVVVVGGLARTRLGKAMRAVSDNPALSASSGMRVDGVINRVWILGTALTGLSGVLLAIDKQVNFQMGFKLLLLVFAAVTLGGLGTIYGAIIGSIIIGLVSEVGPVFGVPASIKDVGPLLLLILILLVRPQGILGRAERVG